MQFAHQVVLLLHLSDGEGQGNSDSQREAFRDSDDDYSDCDNKSIADIANELHVKLAFVVLECLDQSCDDKGDESEKSDKDTQFADTLSNTIEFLLKGSLLVADVHSQTGTALVGVVTNSKDESASNLALFELRSLEEEGVGFGVNVALIDEFFLEAIWLTSESGLRHGAVSGLENKAVSRDLLASLDEEDVADDDLLSVKSHVVATTDHCGCGDVALRHQLLELFLFGVIIADGDNDDDKDSEHDTRAFLEAVSPAVFDDAEGCRHDGSHDEHFEDEVLEDLGEHVAKRADFPLMTFVGAISTGY